MKKNNNYIIILFLLLTLGSCTCLKWKAKEPKGLVKQEKAKELHDNYVNNQYRFINESVKNDSVIIGEETVFPKPKKSVPTKKNGDGGSDDLEIQTEQFIAPEYKDNYEAWFSIDELGSFLMYAQKIGKNKSLTDIGIRVYYASYIIDGEPKTTIFFVPTHFKGGNFDDPNSHENIEGADCLNYGNTGQDPIKYDPK